MGRCSVCGKKIVYPGKTGKKRLGSPELLYPRFGLHGGELLEYISENSCECENCGYVACNLEEKTGITLEMLNEDIYSGLAAPLPNPDISRCCRMAACCKYIGCSYTAAQWYFYAGVLCEWLGPMGKEELKARFYREALLLIKREQKEPHRRSDFELRLAFINILRLLELFEESVKEADAFIRDIDEEKRYQCDVLDIRLLNEIRFLAEINDNRYIPYLQLLDIGQTMVDLLVRKEI